MYCLLKMDDLNKLKKDVGILYEGSAFMLSTESPHKITITTTKKRWDVSIKQLIEIMETQIIEAPYGVIEL